VTFAAKVRQQLRLGGYSPIPVVGGTKQPPMEQWTTRLETNDGEIELWSRMYAYAESTGVLTRSVPALDIDILHQEAAEAVEALTRDRFEEKGYILLRIGQALNRELALSNRPTRARPEVVVP
jgi:hypothetical protein